MPLMHGLLNLIMLAVTIWCYWRILNKAGISPWWAYALLISLAIAYLGSIYQSPIVLIAPYIVPAIMIWVFAYIRWPSFEMTSEAEGKNRYKRFAQPSSDVAPGVDPHRTVNPKFRDRVAEVEERRREREEQ
jgi:thiol:disulfide interchange protein